MKNIVILGSTGSIGRQTLEVVAEHPDKLRVVAIAARREDILAAQARQFGVALVGVGAEGAGDSAIDYPPGTDVRRGAGSLAELARHSGADIVMVATVGRAGLAATLAAV